MRSSYKCRLTLCAAVLTGSTVALVNPAHADSAHTDSAHTDAAPCDTGHADAAHTDLAYANFMSQRTAKFASGPGNLVFLGGSVVLPLLEDGHNGGRHALRTADSIITSTVITEVLKRVVREKRPDSDARSSFPSGHATAAFAAASMASHWHRGQAPLWYLGATAIAVSRVRLHRHFWHDVIAGAIIGYGMTRWELSRRHGLLLAPFIRADESRDKPQDRAAFQIIGKSF